MLTPKKFKSLRNPPEFGKKTHTKGDLKSLPVKSGVSNDKMDKANREVSFFICLNTSFRYFVKPKILNQRMTPAATHSPQTTRMIRAARLVHLLSVTFSRSMKAVSAAIHSIFMTP